MKRSREDITSDLDLTSEQKHEIEKVVKKWDDRISVYKGELAELDLEEAMARSIVLPWNRFVWLATQSDKAWKDTKVTSPLDQYVECISNKCYYSQHLDQLGAMCFLHKLSTLSGDSWILCDECYSDKGKDEILSSRTRFTEKGATTTTTTKDVTIDPNQYEPGLVDAALALKENFEDDA